MTEFEIEFCLSLSYPFFESSPAQATLPIAFGGLGICQATDIALVGFLSNVCATASTVQSLLQYSIHTHHSNEHWESAFNVWSQSFQSSMQDFKIYQSRWDKVISEFKFQNLLQSADSTKEKAHLLAVSSKISHDWLRAIPIASFGLKLDPMSLKISCAHWLGTTLCHNHRCICSKNVDSLGHHGLSCNKTKVTLVQERG